ncbi:MAG: hypothetical protein ABIE22_03540 [archaeon]
MRTIVTLLSVLVLVLVGLLLVVGVMLYSTINDEVKKGALEFSGVENGVINNSEASFMKVELNTESLALETESYQENLKNTENIIEVDDRGFYIANSLVSGLSISKGENVRITLKVRGLNTQFDGLDFRGCGVNIGKIDSGKSETLELKGINTCYIDAYWPSTNAMKARLMLNVN